MKDEIQIELENYCKLQIWIKKQISKKKEIVSEINTLSIRSVKQKLK